MRLITVPAAAAVFIAIGPVLLGVAFWRKQPGGREPGGPGWGTGTALTMPGGMIAIAAAAAMVAFPLLLVKSGLQLQ